MPLSNYEVGSFYDELMLSANSPRDFATPLINQILGLEYKDLQARQASAEALLMQTGVTFTVYSDSRSTEKIMPFDIIPRIISASDWEFLERGLKQRIHAINLFLSDVYGEKKIFNDNVIPRELIFNNEYYLPLLEGFRPPKDVWVVA